MQHWQQAIANTYPKITPHIRRTPIFELPSGSFGTDANLTLKLESLQCAGSFKARGAFSRMVQNHIPLAGVIAASGGNHGAAVAYAAQQLGCPAEIYVPIISSATKVQRLKDFGAKVVMTGADYLEALAASSDRAETTGNLVVHAFNQTEVIAGQGTLALELEQQAPELDTVLVAVGGGGLIAGIAAWYQNRCRVVSVEPERAPSLHAAMQAGERTEVAVGGMTADALGCRRVGEMMFPIAQRFVDQTVLVEEATIATAQKQLWQDFRIAVEPAAAVPIAALISGRYQPQANEKIGVVICGGNANLSGL